MQTGESADLRTTAIESRNQRIRSDEARDNEFLLELELDLACSKNKYIHDY